MNARGFTSSRSSFTIILMGDHQGFMAAQPIATTLRGSAESAGQIKDLTEATSVWKNVSPTQHEAMQQKVASDPHHG